MLGYLANNIWDILTAVGTTGAVMVSLYTILKKPKPKLDLRDLKFQRSSNDENSIIPEILTLDIIPRNFHIQELLFIGVSKGSVEVFDSNEIIDLFKDIKTDLYHYIPEGESRSLTGLALGLGNNSAAVSPLLIFKDERNKSWVYFQGTLKKIDKNTHKKIVEFHYLNISKFKYKLVEEIGQK